MDDKTRSTPSTPQRPDQQPAPNPNSASSRASGTHTPDPSASRTPQRMVAVPLMMFHEQLKQQMRRAFFDILQEKLSAQPPDYDWIVRLYAEIKQRLLALTPKREDLQKSLMESMDVELFDQMLRHNVYDGENLYNLVHFVFGRILMLEAPARNQTTQQMIDRLDALLQTPGTTFGSFVPDFLRSVHSKLDEIEDDIEAFKRQMQAARQGPSPSSSPAVSPAPPHAQSGPRPL